MSILKSKTITHEFSPDEISKLIAADLGVNPKSITVDFVIQEVGGDYMDRYGGIPTVTKIEVTIDELKNKSTV